MSACVFNVSGSVLGQSVARLTGPFQTNLELGQLSQVFCSIEDHLCSLLLERQTLHPLLKERHMTRLKHEQEIWCVWAEQMEKMKRKNPQRPNSNKQKKNDRQFRNYIQLTLWSLSGGRTIVLSMVFRTIFHNSFRTRFSTVFSQILANSIKLQKRAFVSLTAENTQPEPAWRKAASGDILKTSEREEHLWFTEEEQPSC